jgi:hypothetical protein
MMMIMMMMDEVEVLVEEDELLLKFFSVLELVMMFEVFLISIVRLYLN